MGDAIVLAKQAVLPHQALGGLPTPAFTHQGTRSQKNGGFFAPGSSQTDSPGGRRLPSELWVGGAAFHGCLVPGGNARVQPAQHTHRILRAALRPFVLLKAASCIIVQAVVKIKFPSEPCLAWLFVTSEQVSVLSPLREEAVWCPGRE